MDDIIVTYGMPAVVRIWGQRYKQPSQPLARYYVKSGAGTMSMPVHVLPHQRDVWLSLFSQEWLNRPTDQYNTRDVDHFFKEFISSRLNPATAEYTSVDDPVYGFLQEFQVYPRFEPPSLDNLPWSREMEFYPLLAFAPLQHNRTHAVAIYLFAATHRVVSSSSHELTMTTEEEDEFCKRTRVE